MAQTLDPLILDLLDWIAPSRPYADVMDAWRTSCPRLPVWEEANLRGYLTCVRDAAGTELVRLTPAGLAHLRAHRAIAPAHG